MRLRRDLVDDEWFNDIIKTKREELWVNQGPKKESILRSRYQLELIDLNKQNNMDDNIVYQPKQSGTYQWLLNRGHSFK